MRTIPTRTHVPTKVFAVQQEAEKRKDALKYEPQVYAILLNLLIGSDFVMHCNDALALTSAYKHELKLKINHLQPVITKIIDQDLGLLWECADITQDLYSLQDGIRNLIERLRLHTFIRHEPAILVGFGELLDQFHKDPIKTLKRLGIVIEGTEEPEDKLDASALKLFLGDERKKNSILQNKNNTLTQQKRSLKERISKLEKQLANQNKLQAA